LVAARIVYQIVDWLLDNPVDAVVVYLLNPALSFLWIFGSAAVINLIYLKIYEKTKIDWLCVGLIKETALKADQLQTVERYWSKKFRWKALTYGYRLLIYIPYLGARVMLWALNRGHVATFIALSLLQDSFVTTAYFRHGREGNYSHRDWMIYFGSLTLSCAYWTLRWELIVGAAETVWKWVA
jgi:hypothetical protein